MSFEGLKEIMHRYRTGTLSRKEMEMAIGLWQRSLIHEKRHNYCTFTAYVMYAV
jgi:hypothetical protein